MKTNSKNQSLRNWYLFDAKGMILGRLATEIANLLRGKNRPDFSQNLDRGDYVVVINADEFILTGNKAEQKRYYHHTGYLGNLKTSTLSNMKADKPGQVLIHAVSGMLPKNKLQKIFLSRLKVYSASDHPHQNVSFAKTKTINRTDNQNDN